MKLRKYIWDVFYNIVLNMLYKSYSATYSTGHKTANAHSPYPPQVLCALPSSAHKPSKDAPSYDQAPIQGIAITV